MHIFSNLLVYVDLIQFTLNLINSNFFSTQPLTLILFNSQPIGIELSITINKFYFYLFLTTYLLSYTE